MKKILLAMFVAFVSISASAQQGTTALGLNLSYGTDHKAIGIGAKGQYGLTDALRAEASFDYFLKKEGLSMWDINVNLHYLFSVTEQFKVYPLAGVTFTNWSGSSSGNDNNNGGWAKTRTYNDEYGGGSSSTSKFGFNIGAGLQYDLTDKLSINLEGKYQIISDFDQPIFSVGLAYKF